jgi:hypothetical protein
VIQITIVIEDTDKDKQYTKFRELSEQEVALAQFDIVSHATHMTANEVLEVRRNDK